MIKVLTLILFLPSLAFSKGGPLTIVEAAYIKQTLVTDDSYSFQGITADLRMSVKLISDQNFYVSFGGAYSSLSGNLNENDTYQINTIKPYLGFEYFNASKQGINFGVFYAPLSLSYHQNSDQTEQESWNGSSYFVRFSYAAKVTAGSGLMMGLRYDSGTYNTKSSDSFTSADQLRQTLISPFLGYYIDW